MTKTKEIDRHGNVSYRIERDGEYVGRIHKMSGGRWKVMMGDGQITRTSIQSGMRWMEWWLTLTEK